jgi:hypothetical protein
VGSKRQRYLDANMRGGLGVRKRLSEDSMKPSYRLNGVPTGSAVARCLDKYGRWEGGFVLGIIVRKTSSVVQIRWEDGEDIHTYNQGDARYEVDRNRWRILGVVRGNPLDPDNPIAEALNKLRQEATQQLTSSAGSGIMLHAPNDEGGDTPTEENQDMAKEMSNAAREREVAKKAVANGDLKERDTYTAKQVATRCGTDAKTMRKFFRSSHSTVEPVGQGGRYEFDARDFPKIQKEFNAWQSRTTSKSTQKPAKSDTSYDAHVEQITTNPPPVGDDITLDEVADAIERAQDYEPTDEELAELDEIDLDELGEDEDG